MWKVARARGKKDDLFSTTVCITGMRVREAEPGPRAPGGHQGLGREEHKSHTAFTHQRGDDGKEGSESASRRGRTQDGAGQCDGEGPAPHPVGEEGPGAPCTCHHLRGGRSGDRSVRRQEGTGGGLDSECAPGWPEGKGQAAPSDPAGTPAPGPPPPQVPGRTPPPHPGPTAAGGARPGPRPRDAGRVVGGLAALGGEGTVLPPELCVRRGRRRHSPAHLPLSAAALVPHSGPDPPSASTKPQAAAAVVAAGREGRVGGLRRPRRRGPTRIRPPPGPAPGCCRHRPLARG